MPVAGTNCGDVVVGLDTQEQCAPVPRSGATEPASAPVDPTSPALPRSRRRRRQVPTKCLRRWACGRHRASRRDLPGGATASLFPQAEPAAQLGWRIHRAEYADPGATLEVWNAALDRILGQAEQAGINREIPGLISSLLRRAIAVGHGQEDVASVIEVLRSPAR